MWQSLLNAETQAKSPYEGRTFQLSFSFPSEFPFAQPTVRFVTKVYHLNVEKETGDLCLENNLARWTPLITLYSSKTRDRIYRSLESPS